MRICRRGARSLAICSWFRSIQMVMMPPLYQSLVLLGMVLDELIRERGGMNYHRGAGLIGG